MALSATVGNYVLIIHGSLVATRWGSMRRMFQVPEQSAVRSVELSSLIGCVLIYILLYISPLSGYTIDVL